MSNEVILNLNTNKLVDDLVLPFEPTVIKSQDTAKIDAQPQLVFRPMGIMLPRRYPTLKLVDFHVGKRSQLISGGSIPLDCFQAEDLFKVAMAKIDAMKFAGAVAEEVAEIKRAIRSIRYNLGSATTCQIGMLTGVVILNTGREDVLFEGGLVGTGLEYGVQIPDKYVTEGYR